MCGAGVLLWAGIRVLGSPPEAVWQLVGGLAVVALAAAFPLQLPRTKYTVLVADVFTFTLLALLGPGAAILAAGVEGLVGVLRTSKRLSSHISGPAAAMVAMAGGAAVFTVAQQGLSAAGLDAQLVVFMSLCLAAPWPTLLSTSLLMHLYAVKRGQRLQLAQWWSGISWMLATVLVQAAAAGLLVVYAAQHGSVVLLTAACLVLVIVALLRSTISRLEDIRQAQDALVNSAEREAAIGRQRFTAAFTHAAIGMAITHPDGRMVQVNQALCTLLGRSEQDLLGQPFARVLRTSDAELFRREVTQALAAETSFSMELRCQARDGKDVWVVLHCGRFEDPAGAGDGLIYQLHDITSRRLAESRLHHIAYHDGLTDLANRQFFHERLALAVEATRLEETKRFAVMFLDLDRFKMVNDTFGHMAGNDLLREVSQRLTACVRPSDLVARLGGDEFAILLEALGDMDSGLRLADRVLAALSLPVRINGTEVIPGASVGITFSDMGYRSVDEVLRDADLAMYEAKAQGRGRVALFDSSMHERVAEKLVLEGDLRKAIGDGQLDLHFQPIYELQPHRLNGFEALVRWFHPQRGMVSPAVFVALAEESGNITALTDWVIERSVAQLAAWKRQMPEARDLSINVNISGRDITRGSLVTHVQEVLKRHGLPAAALTLEITETTLMGQLEAALTVMARLREIGVRFSIDDFGTGYSSLAYLGTLPIDSLKIDRSFIMGMDQKPHNVEIVRAVLNLGQSLGRKVVAEGIETAEQLTTLRKLGVHMGQGYLLSRPLKAEQATELLTLLTPACA